MRKIAEMLPSEKALWCSKQYELMKQQSGMDGGKAREKKNRGKRLSSKLLSNSKSQKKPIRTDSELAKVIGESRSQVHRYLRLA